MENRRQNIRRRKSPAPRQVLRGQSLLDYVIMVGVALLIALVALGLLGFWPTVTLDFQTRQAISYWQDQARPITVDAMYSPASGTVDMALQTQIDEPITLTSMALNGTTLAFYRYDTSQPNDIGALMCNRASCRSNPCTCAINLPPRAMVRIVSESVSDIVPCSGSKTGLLRQLNLSYSLSADQGTMLNESGPLDLNIVCPSG